MDTNNWRPAQAEPAMDLGDWRTQLSPDSRQVAVNRIMDTLKRHLPVSGQEGLHELRKITVRFEEKIYTAATSQSDYLQKISLKTLRMKMKNLAGNNKNPPGNRMENRVQNIGRVRYDSAESYPPRHRPRRVRYRIRLGKKKKKNNQQILKPSQQESTFLEKSGVKIFHLWCAPGAATVTERRLNNPPSEFGSREELCAMKKIGFDGTTGRTNVVSVHGGGQDRKRERWPWRFHSLQIALSAFSGGKIGEDRFLILCGSTP